MFAFSDEVTVIFPWMDAIVFLRPKASKVCVTTHHSCFYSTNCSYLVLDQFLNKNGIGSGNWTAVQASLVGYPSMQVSGVRGAVRAAARRLRELGGRVYAKGGVLEEALTVVEKQRDELFRCRQRLSSTQQAFLSLQSDIRQCFEAKNKIYQQGWENRDIKSFEKLLTEEVRLAKMEGQIRKDLLRFEEEEKASLDALSNSIWMSHERAMAANAHSKQVSAIASLIGGVLGLATSMLVYRRQLRKVEEDIHHLPDEMAEVVTTSNREIIESIALVNSQLGSLDKRVSNDSSTRTKSVSDRSLFVEEDPSLIPVLFCVSVACIVVFCIGNTLDS